MKRIRLEEDEIVPPKSKQLVLLPSQQIKLLERAEASHYWQMLATVDVATELNPVKQVCCRYCWGQDFLYQFTLNEFREAKLRFEKVQVKKDPHERLIFEYSEGAGGVGYDINRKPNLDCPECYGHGILTFVPINIDKLSYAARMLYDGMKINRDGTVELKLRSRDRAMENLQKIMGFDVPARQNPLEDIETLPDELLDQAISQATESGLLSQDDMRNVIDAESVEVKHG